MRQAALESTIWCGQLARHEAQHLLNSNRIYFWLPCAKKIWNLRFGVVSLFEMLHIISQTLTASFPAVMRQATMESAIWCG